MTSNHTHQPKVRNSQTIQKKLRKINFEKHESTSGFRQRKPRKVTGKLLLVSFLLMAMKGKNSFQNWAWHMSTLSGSTVSRQGLWKRVNDRLTLFLFSVLLDLMGQQISDLGSRLKLHRNIPSTYKRILLQDSTTLALPDWLCYFYPGNRSYGKRKALLKLQVVYDIISECFVHFEITAFSINDQAKAKDIFMMAEEGDLVIRDLGYFVLDSFKEMVQGQVEFISRLRYGLSIYTADGDRQLQLLKELRKNGWYDGSVMVGKKQKLKVRLIASKLPAEQAEKRRRKAKRDRDKRLNHSKDYYEMLGYDLFITNIDGKTATPEQIQSLYGLRWRIESVFRCWKSYFHLQRLIPQGCSLTKERVDSIIYMFLIYILLFHTYFCYYIGYVSDNTSRKTISLAKFCQFISSNIEIFLFGEQENLIRLIAYYCRYDKRNDRQNYAQSIYLG